MKARKTKGMRIIRTMGLLAMLTAASFAQTGPGTVFFYGTHHYADQVLEPYPGGLLNWFIIRAPQPPSYELFHNLLDVHSVTIYKNGVVLTAQGDNAEYGYFVISDPSQYVEVPGFNTPFAGFAMVVWLRDPVGPTDRLRVSFDYVQGN